MITNEKFYEEWKNSGIETITVKDAVAGFDVSSQKATNMLESLVASGKAIISKCKDGKTNQYTIEKRYEVKKGSSAVTSRGHSFLYRIVNTDTDDSYGEIVFISPVETKKTGKYPSRDERIDHMKWVRKSELVTA